MSDYTRDEILAIIPTGESLEGEDLSGADLSGAYMKLADLKWAKYNVDTI
jgi:uncharacterized protein YjbI with pentapeptide repeats